MHTPPNAPDLLDPAMLLLAALGARRTSNKAIEQRARDLLADMGIKVTLARHLTPHPADQPLRVYARG